MSFQVYKSAFIQTELRFQQQAPSELRFSQFSNTNNSLEEFLRPIYFKMFFFWWSEEIKNGRQGIVGASFLSVEQLAIYYKAK